MTKAQPKARPSQPQPQADLNCDPDPMADIFSEWDDAARFRAAHPPAADPVITARREAIRTAYDAKKAEIAAEIDAAKERAGPILAPQLPVAPVVWPDSRTAEAFAIFVKNEFDTGKMPKAKTLTAALRQAREMYVRPDGRQISTVKALAHMIYRKKKRDEGKFVS